MSNLECLGGVLEHFSNQDATNPHLVAPDIIVKENGNTIAKGEAAQIKGSLADKYDRRILNWDASAFYVRLDIEG
jgi:hypothetical protein